MPLSYEIEHQRPTQIGIVVLQADESLEPDFRRLFPEDVEYLVSRVPSDASVSRESLRAMESKITSAASLFPKGAQLSAVAYGCTSASAEIGSDRVAELIRAGVSVQSVTQPVSALLAACAHLGVTRIGILSPYVEAVSEQLHSVLETAGLRIKAFASFQEAEEQRVVRISEGSIVSAAIELGQNTECDAVFLSCTNLRTVGAIPKIESAIGKPVLSSNQVLAWHLGQLAGFSADMNGVGRLFETRST